MKTLTCGGRSPSESKRHEGISSACGAPGLRRLGGQARALAELTDAELEARIKARLKEIEPALIDQWEGRPSD
jgi:hypothetical protein